MPSQSTYVVDHKSLTPPLRLSAAISSRYYPADEAGHEEDLDNILEAQQEEDLDDILEFQHFDIAGDALHQRLLNQLVPVTLIFLDLFGARQTQITISREAHDLNWDVLYDEISHFLRIDDTFPWELSAIRVEATEDDDSDDSDDEARHDPYPPRLLFNRNAIPADVLNRPRFVDLGIVLNRQMNIRDYINQALYDLLHNDMLNMTAPDATYYIPHRHWTISMTARDVQFQHHWRTQN